MSRFALGKGTVPGRESGRSLPARLCRGRQNGTGLMIAGPGGKRGRFTYCVRTRGVKRGRCEGERVKRGRFTYRERTRGVKRGRCEGERVKRGRFTYRERT